MTITIGSSLDSRTSVPTVAPSEACGTAPAGLLALLRAAESQALPELPCPPLVLRVPEAAPVQHEGARAESIHVVRSGGFKCVRMLEDGYEQVLSFAERGDVLGYDGLCHGVHATTAIALEDSTVYVLPAAQLDALALQAPRLDRALRHAVSRELLDAGRTADMMAAVASETRLARFVVWCSDRALERNESPRRLRLRMARRDIASFLGVAHETVSRSFTQLMRQGVLRVDNREIEILDRDALMVASRGTRRVIDEPAPRAIARVPQAAAAHLRMVHALA